MYIRFIYNRIILENATVRAAAVSALSSFGGRCPELAGRVVVLLQRALYDNDDEVGVVVCGLVRGGGLRGVKARQRRVSPVPCHLLPAAAD
jgi:hypothetical protein